MTDTRREIDKIFSEMRYRPTPVMAEVIERTVEALGIEVIFYAYMEGYYHTRDLRTLNREQLKALFHQVTSSRRHSLAASGASSSRSCGCGSRN